MPVNVEAFPFKIYAYAGKGKAKLRLMALMGVLRVAKLLPNDFIFGAYCHLSTFTGNTFNQPVEWDFHKLGFINIYPG